MVCKGWETLRTCISSSTGSQCLYVSLTCDVRLDSINVNLYISWSWWSWCWNCSCYCVCFLTSFRDCIQLLGMNGFLRLQAGREQIAEMIKDGGGRAEKFRWECGYCNSMHWIAGQRVLTCFDQQLLFLCHLTLIKGWFCVALGATTATMPYDTQMHLEWCKRIWCFNWNQESDADRSGSIDFQEIWWDFYDSMLGFDIYINDMILA